MSEQLPHDGNNFDKNFKLGDLLNTLDDSDIGYFAEVDIKRPVEIEEKTKPFPFCSEKKNFPPYNFSEYTKKFRAKTFIQNRNLMCDCTVKNYSWFIIGC